MKIGQKIKVLREMKNFTQEYMADRLGVAQSAYSKLEKEDTDISLSKLEKISEIFNISVEDLLKINENVVFNNFNSTNIQQASCFITTNEKELYDKNIATLEKHIVTLEKEIEHLKLILDKVLVK